MILAEVADKLPRVPGLWCTGIALGTVSFGLTCLWRWFAILVVPLSAWWIYAAVNEFVVDENFRVAVVAELGRPYPGHTIAAACLPFAGAVLGIILHKRIRGAIGRCHENAWL